MKLTARPYQDLAIDNAFEIFKTKQSALMVMFTGGGKTITFAHMIDRMYQETGKRALVLAHRGELITQAADKIERSTGLASDIEMADSYAKTFDSMKAPVVVATVQTLTQTHRLEKFDPSEFGLVVTDESHHATSASYRKIYDYFLDNPDCKHLGVTATPDRADEEALGQIYDDVCLDLGIAEGVQEGWLCGVEQQVVEVESLDISNCGTSMGDIAASDLNAIVEQERVIQEMVVPTIEISGDRKTLVFTSSVAQAEQMCEIFNRYKPSSAEFVCGKTPKDIRSEIVKRYYRGEFQYLVNCKCFTEGYDDPGVEVIANGLITKSRSLYAQIFGRMTRPAEDIAVELNNCEDAQGRLQLIANSIKPKALMIDFAGNAGRHKLVTAADILGGNYSDEVIELAVENARKDSRPEDVMTELQRAEAELAARHKREQEAIEREGIKFGAKYFKYDVSPFDVLDISPSRIPGYIKTKPMSKKQRDQLEKWGIPNVDQIQNTIHASQVMKNCPPSDKQVRQLKRFKIPTDKINRFAANKIMGILARNNWKVTPGSRPLIIKAIKEAS